MHRRHRRRDVLSDRTAAAERLVDVEAQRHGRRLARDLRILCAHHDRAGERVRGPGAGSRGRRRLARALGRAGGRHRALIRRRRPDLARGGALTGRPADRRRGVGGRCRDLPRIGRLVGLGRLVGVGRLVRRRRARDGLAGERRGRGTAERPLLLAGLGPLLVLVLVSAARAGRARAAALALARDATAGHYRAREQSVDGAVGRRDRRRGRRRGPRDARADRGGAGDQRAERGVAHCRGDPGQRALFTGSGAATTGTDCASSCACSWSIQSASSVEATVTSRSRPGARPSRISSCWSWCRRSPTVLGRDDDYAVLGFEVGVNEQHPRPRPSTKRKPLLDRGCG